MSAILVNAAIIISIIIAVVIVLGLIIIGIADSPKRGTCRTR